MRTLHRCLSSKHALVDSYLSQGVQTDLETRKSAVTCSRKFALKFPYMFCFVNSHSVDFNHTETLGGDKVCHIVAYCLGIILTSWCKRHLTIVAHIDCPHANRWTCLTLPTCCWPCSSPSAHSGARANLLAPSWPSLATPPLPPWMPSLENKTMTCYITL